MEIVLRKFGILHMLRQQEKKQHLWGKSNDGSAEMFQVFNVHGLCNLQQKRQVKKLEEELTQQTRSQHRFLDHDDSLVEAENNIRGLCWMDWVLTKPIEWVYRVLLLFSARFVKFAFDRGAN